MFPVVFYKENVKLKTGSKKLGKKVSKIFKDETSYPSESCSLLSAE